jgi:phosphoesterase RecJ-like protein
MSENVYERRSLQDIKLLGVALSTLKISGTGDIAYLEVTKEMLKKTGADLAKAEGFVNYARSIDRAKVAILFREDLKNDGKVFISFRSKGDVDVNRIAKLFGGGGHIKASGCVIEGGMAGVKRKVLAKVEEELKFEIRNPES